MYKDIFVYWFVVFHFDLYILNREFVHTCLSKCRRLQVAHPVHTLHIIAFDRTHAHTVINMYGCYYYLSSVTSRRVLRIAALRGRTDDIVIVNITMMIQLYKSESSYRLERIHAQNLAIYLFLPLSPLYCPHARVVGV